MRDTPRSVRDLMHAGVDYFDAVALRRIAMVLAHWHELECGTDRGHVEFDEDLGYWRFVSDNGQYRGRTPDRETGALRRLGAIMGKYPQLHAYVQGDPRGPSLYIIRPGDVPEGCDIESHYDHGIAIVK